MFINHSKAQGEDFDQVKPIYAPSNLLLTVPKRLIKKSNECHNHYPQPTPDTKRERKKDTNQRVQNKQINARQV